MYRGEVERAIRLVDLGDEDGDSDNNEGREEKGGTTTTSSTAKNVTKKDKNNLENATAATRW